MTAVDTELAKTIATSTKSYHCLAIDASVFVFSGICDVLQDNRKNETRKNLEILVDIDTQRQPAGAYHKRHGCAIIFRLETVSPRIPLWKVSLSSIKQGLNKNSTLFS